MKVHPTAALFPMLQGDDYKQLVEDIRANGQREPIRTWKGMLVDGRNREKVMTHLGLPIKTEAMDFPNDEAATSYILSANLYRRHLDAGQRAMILEGLRPQFTKEAAERKAEGQKKGRENRKTDAMVNAAPLAPDGDTNVPNQPKKVEKPSKEAGKVDVQLAEKAKVSPTTQKKAHKVAEKSPELAEKVRSGEMKLGEAYKEVSPPKPKKEVKPKAIDEHAPAIAQLDNDGLTSTQIARKLGVSDRDVRRVLERRSEYERGRESILDRLDAPDKDMIEVVGKETFEGITHGEARSICRALATYLRKETTQ